MSTPDKNPTPAATQPDDASLHKIRDILVGPTTRVIDERLDEFRKQIEALEKQLRSGLENQQVKNDAAIEQMQRNLESKLDELRKQNGASIERISKVQKDTLEWIERETESIRAGLDRTLATLRAEIIDRQSMASLFSEMALRVAGESGAPIDMSRPDDDFEIMIDQRKKT